jgi:hypothetical protein
MIAHSILLKKLLAAMPGTKRWPGIRVPEPWMRFPHLYADKPRPEPSGLSSLLDVEAIHVPILV